MLSRTADSLYWTGRYMERADFLARILEAAIRLLPGVAGNSDRDLQARTRAGLLVVAVLVLDTLPHIVTQR